MTDEEALDLWLGDSISDTPQIRHAVATLKAQLETARRREADAEYWEGLVIAELATVVRERNHLRAHVAALVECLEFYADPETYFAWAFLGDPPCGEWEDDFEDTGPQLGVKPGKRARAVLDAPDLAALVARAEKEQAVIAAAREACRPDGRGQLQPLSEALAALDTKEPTDG
jgi:hypothetical protein